ncbi:MAG TPA: hypothetical protein VFE01_04260, partial [Terracidiphilus sp.]|nr:hypothetical protein [Terracidiphilus sp.]
MSLGQRTDFPPDQVMPLEMRSFAKKTPILNCCCASQQAKEMVHADVVSGWNPLTIVAQLAHSC